MLTSSRLRRFARLAAGAGVLASFWLTVAAPAYQPF